MSTHSQGQYLFDGDVNHYPDAFLVCRDVGHHWIPDAHWGVTRGRGGVTEYRRTLQCATCGGQRTDRFDADMRPAASPYYHHANGFRVAKDVPNITRADARLEQVRRARVHVRRLKVVGS